MSYYKYVHIAWRQVRRNGPKFCVGVVLLYICLKYLWTTTTPLPAGGNGDESAILVPVPVPVPEKIDQGSKYLLDKRPHSCDGASDRKLTIDCFNGDSKVGQDDPRLVQIVRNNFLYPPPPKGEFDLLGSIPFADRPSDRVGGVSEILHNLSPGFFIECGALDGLFASNTFWLEKKLNWTGLLVEANQNDFAWLANRRRRAWTSNVCLSNRPWPDKVNFYLAPPYDKGGKPGVAGLIRREDYNTIPVQVQCVPLYTLLVALNRTIVDYFSLDVEGSELDILKTVPFDKIIFKVLTIENAYIAGGHEALKKFLESKGYIFYQFAPDLEHPWDSIFLHSSIPLANDLIKSRVTG